MSERQPLDAAPEGDDDARPASADKAKAADQAKARAESREESVTTPGGFNNDPEDPTNPNEVIERHRRKLRP